MNHERCAERQGGADFMQFCNGYDIMKCPICEEHVNYEIALDDKKAFCTCTICGTIVVINLKLDDTPDYDPPY